MASKMNHLLAWATITHLTFIFQLISSYFINSLDRRKSKTVILSKNVDQKSFETGFLLAICRQFETGFLLAICRQSKTLFLAIFDPRSSIV